MLGMILQTSHPQSKQPIELHVDTLDLVTLSINDVDSYKLILDMGVIERVADLLGNNVDRILRRVGAIIRT